MGDIWDNFETSSERFIRESREAGQRKVKRLHKQIAVLEEEFSTLRTKLMNNEPSCTWSDVVYYTDLATKLIDTKQEVEDLSW